MTQRRVTTILAGALVVASAGAAQETRPAAVVDTPAFPTRVRLTMTNGRRLKVELLRVERGGFLVRKPGRFQEPAWTVPRVEVGTAERSLGRLRGRAAGMGAFLGGVVAVAFLAASGVCDDERYCGLAALILVPPPTLLGAGIGALVAGEGWEPLALPPTTGSQVQARQWTLEGSARGGTLAVSVTIRF